jgi:hypothetical protein
MRTILASLASVSILAAATAAHAQGPAVTRDVASSDEADPGPQDTITTNPVLDILGLADLAYERAVSRHASILVEGVFGSVSASSGTTTMSDTFGSVTVQPHFYFGDRTLEGFYVAPLLQVAHLSAQDQDGVTATGTGVAAGATGGYAWLLGPVALKLGLGGKVSSASARAVGTDGKVATASGVGATITMDFSAGFAF